MINSFDYVILSETWKKVTVEVNGYKIVTTDTLKTGKCGCNSGGLALLYKLKYDDWISVQKESPNFLKATSRNPPPLVQFLLWETLTPE